MTYILIMLLFSYHYDTVQVWTKYKIYKNNNKEELVRQIKACNDDNTGCRVETVIGCNFGNCKEYNYKLKTSPEIKDTVELKEQ